MEAPAPDAAAVGEQPRRTVEYAAEYYNVSPRRIYEWIEGGELEHFRFGHRTVRFSDAQLERFARSREVA
jgi:excisionase family DNA binding protein